MPVFFTKAFIVRQADDCVPQTRAALGIELPATPPVNENKNKTKITRAVVGQRNFRADKDLGGSLYFTHRHSHYLRMPFTFVVEHRVVKMTLTVWEIIHRK